MGNWKREGTHEERVVDGARAVLQPAVEELAERRVLREVRGLDLREVAAKRERVEAEAEWPEPERELERVEVPP